MPLFDRDPDDDAAAGFDDVAADDGFMPQTDEALKHIQNAKVALIVAVTSPLSPAFVLVPDGDGYRVTGKYNFGSGVRHSAWIGAGTLTVSGGGRLNRAPIVRDDTIYLTSRADATPGDPTKPAGDYLVALDANRIVSEQGLY